MTQHTSFDATSDSTEMVQAKSEWENAPRLSGPGLMITMLVVCSTPLVILFWLQFYVLPPVHELELEAEVFSVDFPSAEYYAMAAKDRPNAEDMPQPIVRVKNTGDVDWTNILVSINERYKWAPMPDSGGHIAAGEEREFYVCRFQVRTGGPFEWSKYPVKRVHVYARLPSGERATFYKDFEFVTVSP